MAVHAALERLPMLTSPADVRVSDGIYFFYEEHEHGPHAPSGRVVRVGTHRAAGGLAPRLAKHYSGQKNGSAFRKSLGGALLRRRDEKHPCLAPRRGSGHWEHQGGRTCPLCAPVEAEVSRLLRTRFAFRVVAVADPGRRKVVEERLIATLAQCRECQPSSAWLGSYAYAHAMRESGLWNTLSVNGPRLTASRLEDFEGLIA